MLRRAEWDVIRAIFRSAEVLLYNLPNPALFRPGSYGGASSATMVAISAVNLRISGLTSYEASHRRDNFGMDTVTMGYIDAGMQMWIGLHGLFGAQIGQRHRIGQGGV